MGRRGVFIKILAIVGTSMVWFPVLAPVIFSLTSAISDRMFRFDYLMPAELFPFVIVGVGALVWAAVLTRRYRKLILCGLSIMIASIVSGQVFAVVTGLASGETEPVGWPWALVLSSIIIYTLSIVMVGVGGILLLYDIFRAHQSVDTNRNK